MMKLIKIAKQAGICDARALKFIGLSPDDSQVMPHTSKKSGLLCFGHMLKNTFAIFLRKRHLNLTV